MHGLAGNVRLAPTLSLAGLFAGLINHPIWIKGPLHVGVLLLKSLH